MAYDPDDNTHHTIIREYFGGQASIHSPPRNLEPELKLIVKEQGCFQGIFETVISSQHTICVDTKLTPQDYTLLSIGLDTPPDLLSGPRQINQAGFQYRVRGNLVNDHSLCFSAIDATAKSLHSNMSCGRTEIETDHGDLSRDDIDNSLQAFRDAKGDSIAPIFKKLNDIDLCVESLCMTSRMSYHFALKLEPGIIACYHATADANKFITPDGSLEAGSDFEAEFEISSIISTSGSLNDSSVRNVIEYSQNLIEDIIKANHAHEVSPSPSSKLVRSAGHVADLYKKNNKTNQPTEVAQNGASIVHKASDWGLLAKIKPSHVLEEGSHSQLIGHASRLPKPEELVSTIENVLQTGQRTLKVL